MKEIKNNRGLKKIFWLILVICFALSSFSMVFAADTSTVKVSSVNVNHTGNEQTVIVEVSMTPPQILTVKSLKLAVVYDDTKLTPTEAKFDSKFTGTTLTNFTTYKVTSGTNAGKKAVFFSYTNMDGLKPENIQKSPLIGTIQFKIPASAQAGEVYYLTADMTATLIEGSSTKEVDFTAENGKITVSAVPSTNANLKVITLDGVALPIGEAPQINNFIVELPFGKTTAPIVGAIAADANSKALETTQASSVPGEATIVVTAQDGITTKTYTIRFRVKRGNTNANLSAITLDGVALTGFDPEKTTYDVELPFGKTTAPILTARATDINAKSLEITQASSVPGEATIVVTAQDGITTKIYTINFTVQKQFTVTATKNVVGNKVSVNVTVNNNGSATNAVVVVALYDNNNASVTEMKTFFYKEGQLQKGDTMVDGEFMIPVNYTIKVFVWDGFTTQNALSEVKTVQ